MQRAGKAISKSLAHIYQIGHQPSTSLTIYSIVITKVLGKVANFGIIPGGGTNGEAIAKCLSHPCRTGHLSSPFKTTCTAFIKALGSLASFTILLWLADNGQVKYGSIMVVQDYKAQD